MRRLTSKQKKLLDYIFTLGIQNADDIPNNYWLELEELNDTEILYQEVDRYLYSKWELTPEGTQIYENNLP